MWYASAERGATGENDRVRMTGSENVDWKKLMVNHQDRKFVKLANLDAIGHKNKCKCRH